MRAVSLNTLNLYGSDSASEQERYRAVEAFLRTADADVIAVQEVIAPEREWQEKAELAERHVHQLAEATGRVCTVDGVPACGVGGGAHHTGLLWRDGIEVVPGSLTRLGRADAGMWHSLVAAVFDLGGPTLRVASVHLSPYSPAWRETDAAQVLRAINADATPGIVGGDFNGVAADSSYDPDPYAGVAWHPVHAQAFGPGGGVDRRAPSVLERQGRLQDCARLAGAPWTATVGHWPDDPHPPRRIDRWYGSWHLPPGAVTGFRVLDGRFDPAYPPLPEISDHLPIEVTLDLS
ncbi:endonuclease/exonuclease/phosphatase family protein [Cryptosporangium aurantiacum]|uniref:Metal-dependent hydrolase, endonuclease/exonuclease/phosphatase family n=1 Tax=Cryptosporangium aurantiacum TaxID=134849 RepID=A0A1M7TYR4_9ACTN|nr:endonuclease/exonuclease/phosphatase family protein [Cryptosporangium aurantiacum]SHN75896.1 Metal-dependent hydrolase, endonuclease/exonuclease/phosphatase family [Cryptosporangium aurantiacum]